MTFSNTVFTKLSKPYKIIFSKCYHHNVKVIKNRIEIQKEYGATLALKTIH